MATISAARRRRLERSAFALPEQRKYPIPDRAHAANAKGRAMQQYRAGNLSRAQLERVDRAADRVLGNPWGAPSGGLRTMTETYPWGGSFTATTSRQLAALEQEVERLNARANDRSLSPAEFRRARRALSRAIRKRQGLAMRYKGLDIGGRPLRNPAATYWVGYERQGRFGRERDELPVVMEGKRAALQYATSSPYRTQQVIDLAERARRAGRQLRVLRVSNPTDIEPQDGKPGRYVLRDRATGRIVASGKDQRNAIMLATERDRKERQTRRNPTATHHGTVDHYPDAGYHAHCSCGWGRWRDTRADAEADLIEHVQRNNGFARNPTRRNPALDPGSLPKFAALGVFCWAVYELLQPMLHAGAAHANTGGGSSGGGGGTSPSGWRQLSLVDNGQVPLEALGGRVRQSAAWIAAYCPGCAQNEYHAGAVFWDGSGSSWLWQGGDVLQGPDVPNNDLSQTRHLGDFGA